MQGPAAGACEVRLPPLRNRARNLRRGTRLGEFRAFAVSCTSFELGMIDELAAQWRTTRSDAIVRAVTRILGAS